MIAYVFPGQGAQKVGMGRALAATFPICRQTFEEADDALGESLSGLCFDGPESQLLLTENTQPAILAVSVAACRLAAAQGVTAAFAAGHSLGEDRRTWQRVRYPSRTPCGRSAGVVSSCRKLCPSARGRCLRFLAPMPTWSRVPAPRRAPADGPRRFAGQPQCARSSRHCRSCERRRPRRGAGQSRRRQAGDSPRGECTLSLRAHEAGRGSAGAASPCAVRTDPRHTSCRQRRCRAKDDRR